MFGTPWGAVIAFDGPAATIRPSRPINTLLDGMGAEPTPSINKGPVIANKMSSL
jgi:hypothetical protein